MSNQMRLYVDIHVLQTVPPSCVNRDDTGSPKTAYYGGVTRARVSSQAWKRAVRVFFKDHLSIETGKRTKNGIELLAKAIRVKDNSIEASIAESLAIKVFSLLGIKNEKNKKKGGYELKTLFFFSNSQIKKLAEVCYANREILKKANDTNEEDDDNKAKKNNKNESLVTIFKNALSEEHTADILLFGRMVASEKASDIGVDACCQVAHALSTHAVHNEYDYFTAVDDCISKGSVGAAHLDTVEYNSATLYRYATINVKMLADSLQGDTASLIRSFADAFVRSMPTGKQNTFANGTLPDMIYVTLRHDQPVNFVNAFETPVKAGENGGYAVPSCEAFKAYANKLYDVLAPAPDQAYVSCIKADMSALGEIMPLESMLDRLESDVAAALNKEAAV